MMHYKITGEPAEDPDEYEERQCPRCREWIGWGCDMDGCRDHNCPVHEPGFWEGET